MSLREALEQTATNRAWALDTGSPTHWRPYWLVVMTSGPQRLYADCRTDEPFHNPRAVRLGVVPWEWEEADLARAGSLLRAASSWRWLLERDLYAVEPGGDLRPRAWADLPLWMRLSGLAEE